MIDQMPQAFVDALREAGVRRGHVVRDPSDGSLRTSHPVFDPVAAFVAGCSDFRDHEGMFFQVSRDHDTLQGAFVHRTVRGQAAGGVRYWRYPTLEAYLRDGLRLAVGMSHKNALAGLWWGGGKGVMARNPAVDRDDPAVRASLYREYGEFMTVLCGCYVTAADVGTKIADMAHIHGATRFTTCIPEAIGGSGDPSLPTARGVVAGIAAALAFLGDEGLAGRTVAIQGLGKVGWPLVQRLLERDVARIVACDIDEDLVVHARDGARGLGIAVDRFEARVVADDDPWIFGQPCDAFAPCATGAILNADTIPRLRSRIVCGAANNQLADPVRDDERLAARGIVYVPDFLTNRMGIVTCADESAGYVTPDPMIERHLSTDWPHSIHRCCLDVLEKARATGRPPGAVATELAETLTLEPNPIFGHRGQAIIDSLVRDRWWQTP